MNYLKSITTSVLNSTGVSFPFSIGERIAGIEQGATLWDIREGVKKDDGTLLTLFIFDSTLPNLNPGNRDRRTLLQLAKNALKKLRTIRHPDVIKYIDSVETDTHVYIATERVRPFQGVLRDWTTGGSLSSRGKGKDEWIGWGLQSISTALAFLNSAPLSLQHAYAIPETIFITPSLEFRLGGFELLTGKDDANGVLWALGGLAPGDVGQVSAPEVKKSGWGVLRDTDPSVADSYLLAMLIFSLYNPTAPVPTITSNPPPSVAGAIPKQLLPIWRRMLTPNPRTRLSTSAFVAEVASSGFWAQNPLAFLVENLEGFELKAESDKLSVLRLIKEYMGTGSVPQPFLLYKVLPSILHSLSLPTAPSGAMLPLVLELGKLVPPTEYPKLVLDPVVKLYTSPDRGTRMALLDGLGEYADKLDQRTVVDKVWPNLITGFADTVPLIREATVKAVFPLAPKFSDRILNNDLLRLLAKMQTDTEPSIRTNTCILLGRLAPLLGPTTKKKVLVPAFARSLKDPFVHARVAGLMSLMATVECFDRDDLAGRVVPNMSFALVDREKLVRDQAFKAINMFLKRIEAMAAEMPATILSEDKAVYGPVTAAPAAASNSNQANLASSATGAAGALAGWAIASIGKQLSNHEVHSSLSSAPAQAQPQSSFPSTLQTTLPAPSTRETPLASPNHSDSDSFAFGSTSTGPSKINVKKAPARPHGMKLGGTQKAKPNSSLAETVASEWDERSNGWDDDNDDGVADAWGNDDLIDVHADQDDWAAFESAPVPEIVAPPAQSYYINTPAPPVAKAAVSKPATRPTPAPTLATKPAASVAKTAPVLASPESDGQGDGWGDVDAPAPAPAPPKSPASTSGAASPARSNTPQPSLAGLSKEDKDKEMARRREERKARIAAMKEQKKAKA